MNIILVLFFALVLGMNDAGFAGATENGLSEQGSEAVIRLDSLLERLRESRVQESRINLKREEEFLARKDARKRLLEEAKEELIRNDKETNTLLAQIDANAKELGDLKETLRDRAGSLHEMFGLIRQSSGDLSAIIQESLVSAQYPNREQFLDSLSRNERLPPPEELEKFWYALLQEMTQSGKVIRFSAPVTSPQGETQNRFVTRVGGFTATAGGKFLRYSPQIGNLMELSRQPPSRYSKLAKRLESSERGIVPMLIDPTRGAILDLLVQKPDLLERINQGGAVGYMIILIGCIGILLASLRHVSLIRTAKRIEKQLRNIGTPSSDNPLGRVLVVLKRMDKANPETLELSLDEAILKEIPHLERGHALIKLLAAIAPLLGLLGTVIGMIITFQTITLFGTGDPKLMADGISQALVTTALGLLVSIPLLFAHSLVTARSKSLIQVLDQQSAGLIAARIEQHRGEHRDRASPILT